MNLQLYQSVVQNYSQINVKLRFNQMERAEFPEQAENSVRLIHPECNGLIRTAKEVEKTQFTTPILDFI
jgi:hypothetical protein